MYIKQKIIRDKQQPKNRYNLPSKNSDSTPNLLLQRQMLFNKENNMNHHNNNHQTSRYVPHYDVELLRSLEIPKRLRTSINDEQNLHFRGKDKQGEDADGLRSSQQLFHFRQKNMIDRHESANFGEHLTFGQVNNKRQMMTSRQFLQQKKMKNDVIDEIITNNKRGLCKSFNEFSIAMTGNCINHLNKKAKYRLISQLSQGEQQMFYCSKCAINLLQQGFKIEQIKQEQLQNQNSGLMRMQQITKFTMKLKELQETTRNQYDYNEKQELRTIQDEIYNCNQKFTNLFAILEELRRERLTNLSEMYRKRESQQKNRKESLKDIIGNIEDIQKEIREFKNMKKFSAMKQNEFQFLTTTLNNKIGIFQSTLNATQKPSPKNRLSLELTSYENIIEKMKLALSQKQQHTRTRRQRQITFQRKVQHNQRVSDQFGCDELKKPFRILFPTEEIDLSGERHYQKRSMLSSVRQCPSFGQYP